MPLHLVDQQQATLLRVGDLIGLQLTMAGDAKLLFRREQTALTLMGHPLLDGQTRFPLNTKLLDEQGCFRIYCYLSVLLGMSLRREDRAADVLDAHQAYRLLPLGEPTADIAGWLLMDGPSEVEFQAEDGILINRRSQTIQFTRRSVTLLAKHPHAGVLHELAFPVGHFPSTQPLADLFTLTTGLPMTCLRQTQDADFYLCYEP